MTCMRWTTAAVVLAAWLPAGPPAHAADDETATQLLAEIATAHKAPERAGLAAALERVPEAHNGLGNAGLRKKLQAALGKVLHDARAGGDRTRAAEALGKLDDPPGAWKQLGKALPKPKDKEATPAQLAALQAAGRLAPAGAVPTLLKLAAKGKALPAVREAVLALGGYGRDKRRESILKELLDLTARHHAAAQAASDPKKGGGDRPWKELGPALIASMKRLTGQGFDSADAWLEARKANKKKLGALFNDA